MKGDPKRVRIPAMATPDRVPQATVGRRNAQRRALALGTLAFFTCFYAWSVMVAVPVILGSLMRIPMGILTDIYGGRPMFTALIVFTLLPLVGLAVWHDSYGGVLLLGFLLGFAGSSFAIGVPFVNKWFEAERQGFALGVYGMGMGGTVLGGLTAPKIVDAWGLTAPFLVAAGALAFVGAGFALLARDASPPSGGRITAQRVRAPLAVFRRSRKAWALTLFYFLSFGGFVAMFLYLPKLLTGVHDLTKTDAGARAAGFALLAVLARPIRGARAALVVRRHDRTRARAGGLLREHGPAHDRVPLARRRVRARHWRRLQARGGLVPARRGSGDGRGGRRRRPGRVLPTARDGDREGGDRQLHVRVHPARGGRGRRARRAGGAVARRS